jgi:hypothetical protein
MRHSQQSNTLHFSKHFTLFEVVAKTLHDWHHDFKTQEKASGFS